MSFSVFEKIDPSCQNGSMEKAKNLPYHQRPYASIAERTLVDISIYSPRPQIAGTGHSHSKISIHSPRAGRDCRYPNAPLITQISIHSPHTGRDRLVNAPIVSPSLFQSTLPAWGETQRPQPPGTPSLDFNPLSPHGERPRSGRMSHEPLQFQSTLPAWGETPSKSPVNAANEFQSTLPAWGETGNGDRYHHAQGFQSTLPAWGETVVAVHGVCHRIISIHSPRMGRDCNSGSIPTSRRDFNPLSPHGERRKVCAN